MAIFFQSKLSDATINSAREAITKAAAMSATADAAKAIQL